VRPIGRTRRRRSGGAMNVGARRTHFLQLARSSERAEPFFYLAVLTNAAPLSGPALQSEEA